jgi:hypothetical protein
VNEFTEKEKVETVDPRNQDSWCIGTIVEKDGPRLRLRLDGTDDRNDFWRLVDSADIRRYGKTEESVRKIRINHYKILFFCLVSGRTNCSTTWFSTKFKSLENIF